MNRVLNCFFEYNLKQLTYATGLVRPKTTALFFDKLWLPCKTPLAYKAYHSIYDGIPEDIRFYEKEMYDAYKSQHMYPSFDWHIQRNIGSPFDSGDSFSVHMLHNSPIYMKNSSLGMTFLTSHNRNKGIIEEVYRIKRIHGIDITPIFIDKTEFEKQFSIDTEFDTDGGLNLSVIAASIKSVPMIVEDNLAWEQVKQIRNDKKSIKKLRRFRTWAMSDLIGKSQAEIADILCYEIEKYSSALRKHGILTAIGGFTTILSGSSTLLGAINSSQPALLAAGLSISAGLITFMSDQITKYNIEKQEPIAYIYDITKDVI